MVADAPRNTPQALPMLQDFDDDQPTKIGNSTAGGVDLSLLMACLCSEDEVGLIAPCPGASALSFLTQGLLTVTG